MEKRNFKNTLIVGWNNEAVSLYDRLLDTPALGYYVRGFIKPTGLNGKTHYKNVPILGDLTNFADAIQRLEITDVLIVLSQAEKKYLIEFIDLCTKYKVAFRIVSDAFDNEYEHVIRNVIKDVILSKDFRLRSLFDLFGALILMILLFPVFLLVAVAIKLESNGPIFYSQKRYGLNSKIFNVYKFRSMVQDAEKKSGPAWATKNDPRITRVGNIMRKTRIDELPQLMNIMKGDMSFIGPRPERPFFADNFKKQIPFYMNRLKAKPGITGLAQVTVGYDETIEDVKEKVWNDIKYIESMNSWKLNVKILWMTFLVVFTGKGQ
jgi:exopolysaccharide biosynthesis polyprenyl glycosylphosphotransferase